MSDYSTATTHESEPDGVLPVTAVVEPNRLDTIFLSWRPPLKPNGMVHTGVCQFAKQMFANHCWVSDIEQTTW